MERKIMKHEVRYLIDDPESTVITDDIKITLDGSPSLVEELRDMIDVHAKLSGWEKL